MYLLDTCAFIWYLEDNPRLSAKAKTILNNEKDVFLSLTTLWEIAVKKRRVPESIAFRNSRLHSVRALANARTLTS